MWIEESRGRHSLGLLWLTEAETPPGCMSIPKACEHYARLSIKTCCCRLEHQASLLAVEPIVEVRIPLSQELENSLKGSIIPMEANWDCLLDAIAKLVDRDGSFGHYGRKIGVGGGCESRFR